MFQTKRLFGPKLTHKEVSRSVDEKWQQLRVGRSSQSLNPLILILSTSVHNNDVVAGQQGAAPCRHLVRLSGKMASLARIAAVAQSWLDRKETLPEGDGLLRRRRHHRSGTSRVLEKSHLPDSGGGCAAAANETGATMSAPSQRAGNDRSKQDPAAAAVPSKFARRGDLKGLSEGRPPFPAPPGRFAAVRFGRRSAAPP